MDNTTILDDLNSLTDYISPAIRTILALIYRNVGITGLSNQLHPNTLSYLRNLTLQLIATDLNNQQWLLNHLKLLQKEGIPVILLKGAAFSQNLYPDNAPRLGVDLDLLVNPKDFDQACTLLGNTMQPVLLDTKRVATHETLFERVFVPKNSTGPTVEIHRGLTNPLIFTIEQQNLWAASGPHPAYPSELVRTLSAEDSLLHLAVHAFRDLDYCTHNLLDAHEVWCQWKPDKVRLLNRATEWGARKVLYYLLASCKSIMDTPVPNTLLDNLRPARGTNTINRIILQSPVLSNSAHTSMRYRLLQLVSQITFPDSPFQGLRFQVSYAETRLKDLLARK